MHRREAMKLMAVSAVGTVAATKLTPDNQPKLLGPPKHNPAADYDPDDIYSVMRWSHHQCLTDKELLDAIAAAVGTTAVEASQVQRLTLSWLLVTGNAFPCRIPYSVEGETHHAVALYPPRSVSILVDADTGDRRCLQRSAPESSRSVLSYTHHVALPGSDYSPWGTPPLVTHGRKKFLELLANRDWVNRLRVYAMFPSLAGQV